MDRNSGHGTIRCMNALMCVLVAVASTTYPVAVTYTPPLSPTRNVPHTIALVDRYSGIYGVDAYIMRRVIMCESGYDSKAVGDGGTSFGLSQIHLPAHPEITKEQAFNPEFAVEFMAKEMSAGRAWKWTCFKMFYPRDLSPILSTSTDLISESESDRVSSSTLEANH